MVVLYIIAFVIIALIWAKKPQLAFALILINLLFTLLIFWSHVTTTVPIRL